MVPNDPLAGYPVSKTLPLHCMLMDNPDTEAGSLQLKPKYQRFDDFVKVMSDIPDEMVCVSDAL